MNTDTERRIEELPEHREGLWRLALGPATWFAHFLLCYTTAAVWCAKFLAPTDSLATVRLLVVVYTLLALATIATVGFGGWRRYHYGNGEPPYNEDTAEDRHRFLGFATLLLCGLSFVATLYVASTAVFIGSCG